MKAKPEEQEEARRMRREHGLPMRQIASRLSVSSASVYAWTRDIVISPEQNDRNLQQARVAFAQKWAELNRDRRREAQAQGRRRAREADPLHEAGCMLYWAEGAKDRNNIAFANSDASMIRFFANFMRTCFSIQPADLSLRLNVYLGNGLSLREIEDRWLSVLDLPRTCLRKHVVNHFPTSSSGRRPHRLPFGVCTLRVLRSTYLVQHIYGAIQEYGGFDEPRWLDGPPRKPKPASADQ
jgi:transcriptional regulator with XRE-family HTH domain